MLIVVITCGLSSLSRQDIKKHENRNNLPLKNDAWDKCSDLVHWEDPEGSRGEGGGRGDRDGEYMCIHGWFMSMYDKNHYNIVK